MTSHAQRDAILAIPRLAAAMLLNERRAGFVDNPAWLGECWSWLTWLSATRGLAVATRTSYVATLGGFADWVCERGYDYRDMSIDQLDEWMRDLWFRLRWSAGHRSVAMAALRNFYDWRHTRGLGRNCTEGMARPKIPRRTPRKYTKPQLQKLFAAARKGATSLISRRDETLLAMLYATGMRRDEIASLRIDQIIEMDGRTAVIRIEGKGSREREVAIEGPVVRLLQEWLRIRADLPDARNDRLFVTVSNGPWKGQPLKDKTVEDIVRAIARRAGLGEWGVHRFRVTFATQLYDDGVDIERIRILLGHSSIETTRSYLAVASKFRKYRLKSMRQHEVLGTVPDGLPRWAKAMRDQPSNGTGVV